MSMHFCNQGRVNPTVFVVCCKRCDRNVPAGVEAFPTGNLRVDCPLCGEKRRYRPTEVFLGFPNLLVTKQQVRSVTPFHHQWKRKA